VGVFGVGVEGRANVRRLLALGAEPVLVDDDPPSHPVEGLAVAGTAAGGLDELRRCEVVVKTPGLSRYRSDVASLVEAGVAVVGGLGLWMAEAPRERVVCVTGTKGKSTTTAVCGHLLTGLGYRAVVGGNIGLPPWDPDTPSDADYYVVETSSFQATDLPCSPPVVAVTSLAPDHLDWHGDAETYFTDKLSACHQPGADLTVADGENELLAARAGQLGPRVRWVVVGDPELDGAWVDELGLLGRHNRRNALVARACLVGLGIPEAADDAALAEAARGFVGLGSRLQRIGSVDGVDFYDDSLATNVLPTVAALEALPGRRTALLVGGFDRGVDYGPLAEALAERREATLVLTLPANGPRIHEALTAGAPGVEVRDRPGLDEAVADGFTWAGPGGVVLLSPAAASFGGYRDYAARAEAFAAAARRCGELTA